MKHEVVATISNEELFHEFPGSAQISPVIPPHRTVMIEKLLPEGLALEGVKPVVTGVVISIGGQAVVIPVKNGYQFEEAFAGSDRSVLSRDFKQITFDLNTKDINGRQIRELAREGKPFSFGFRLIVEHIKSNNTLLCINSDHRFWIDNPAVDVNFFGITIELDDGIAETTPSDDTTTKSSKK